MTDKNKVIQAMTVINNAQQTVWELHHKVKSYDEELGMKIWEQTLQIEHALLVLNEEVLGGKFYFERPQ